MHAFSSILFEESIRVDKIIWLGANTETQCDDLEELLEEKDTAVIAALFDLPNQVAEDYADKYDCEGLMVKLVHARRLGFLVKAATPIPMTFHASGHSYTWGLYTTKWFYVESIDQAFIDALVKWKEDFIAAERARKQKGTRLKTRGGANPKI